MHWVRDDWSLASALLDISDIGIEHKETDIVRGFLRSLKKNGLLPEDFDCDVAS